MFCPECGRALPEPGMRFCPFCGSRIVVPAEAETSVSERQSATETVETEPRAKTAVQPQPTHSKICTAALLLGTGTVIFGMFTLVLRMLNADLRVLGTVSAVTFFLAPLACIFGLAGIVVRAANRQKRGLPSAICGLLFGLAFGALAAVALLSRILFY